MVIALRDNQLHCLAGLLQCRREIPRLALEFGCLERTVEEHDRRRDLPEMPLRRERLFDLVGERYIARALGKSRTAQVVHSAREHETLHRKPARGDHAAEMPPGGSAAD